MRHRRGKTLIELAVAISVMAVVLTSGVRMLRVLFRAERSGTQRASETAAFGQLAREFRRDVHAADRVRLVSNPDGSAALELTLVGGQRLLYSADGGTVVKAIHRDRAEPAMRQRFRLPERRIRFEQAADGRTAALICDPERGGIPAANAGGRLSPTLRVLAIVGWDLRLSGGEP